MTETIDWVSYRVMVRAANNGTALIDAFIEANYGVFNEPDPNNPGNLLRNNTKR
jgi:phage tail protein X